MQLIVDSLTLDFQFWIMATIGFFGGYYLHKVKSERRNRREDVQ